MSITITSTSNQVGAFNGGPSDNMWLGQPAAGMSCFLKYTGNPAALANANVFRYGNYARFGINCTTANSNSVKFNLFASNTSGSISGQFSAYPDVVYHVAMSWVSGRQVCYVNGIPIATASVVGNTSTVSQTLYLWTMPAAAPVTLSDFTAWNGYALTQADVLALRDGAPPSTVGTSATQVVEFTFAGPTGATPAVGDPGLKNAIPGGVSTSDFTTRFGTWTGAYSPQLAYTPLITAVVSSATVLTSGTLVRFVFTDVPGALTTFLAPLATPTISVNGADLGALIPVPLDTSANAAAIFRVPGGVRIAPGDVVTYSAPTGWAGTLAGVPGAAVNAPMTNCSGRPSSGADTLAKTFRPGMNFPWSVTTTTPFCAFANQAFRMGNMSSGSGTLAKDGTLALKATTAQLGVMNDFFQTGLPSSTIIQTNPEGYYAVAWDDLDPIANPTTLSLVSGSPHSTLTEVASCRNTGVNGVGQVRVFQYAYTDSSRYGAISVQFSCPTKSGKIGNMWVLPPWGFTFTPGTPCTVDTSDPLKIDARLLARFPNGLGAVRCMDSTWSNAGSGWGESEPEDAPQLGPVLPAAGGFDQPGPGITQGGPWDTTVSPYVYSATMGTPFQATLGAPIADTGSLDANGRLVSTITISDAATAPVIVGLVLRIDSEDMGVLAVSGTQVTVRRGSRSTTPATHTAGVGTLGSVTVTGRIAASLANLGARTFAAEFVTQSPHGLVTGAIYRFAPFSSWPTFTDNQKGKAVTVGSNNGWCVPLVTGPSTFVIPVAYGAYDGQTYPASTATAAVAMNPAQCYLYTRLPAPGNYPIEIVPKLADALNANAHVNVPSGANDDMVDALARRVRDAMTPGRIVYVEYVNEPWNVAIPMFPNLMQAMSRLLYAGSPVIDAAYYVERSGQVWQRFKDRFNEGGRNRGGEIRGIFNLQLGADASWLTYGLTKGVSADAVALAPYQDIWSNAAMYTAARGATDEELIDLYVNDIWYKTLSSTTKTQFTSASIAAYNAANGKSAFLYGYEGGDQHLCATPNGGTAIKLATPPGATDTTLTIAANQGTIALFPGDYIMITADAAGQLYTYSQPTDEWAQVTAFDPVALTITVTRGMLGTTAQAHTGTTYVRSMWVEKQRDMIYHPNWAHATTDYHAFLQSVGFREKCHYAYSMPYVNGQSMWGVYHNAFQMPGKGDGSDGQANNRNYLATPGQPKTLAAGVVQDSMCVSPRGYAINQWMAEVRQVNPVGPKASRPSARKFLPLSRFR
ncbi:hypothetical protein OJF2_72530 [Aquisphaera giovannonii]|uniref:Uncharacterized protein n=1 Tax=Aquisphaera giovannonii TaxID=406548 RepID=A0A5B9WDQ7_9BACT|nr:hypothetical protein [Aquisphaera giovannonii]QEH38647.1 hypothetical protein OJF2_72530 [Aquisphaera giovannonii]